MLDVTAGGGGSGLGHGLLHTANHLDDVVCIPRYRAVLETPCSAPARFVSLAFSLFLGCRILGSLLYVLSVLLST